LRPKDTSSLLASLDGMQAKLRGLVVEIKDSSANVALAADEIAQGNTELSSRTEEQAAALQETAASMEQLTATVKSNASGAQHTATSARETANLAQRGEADMQRMSATMKDISDSAAKIRDITGVIEGIAFQTNILALNAAVEAARAGEQGRGFAVVAGEVRNLAQRSATAAKEIKTLIEQAVQQVETGVTVASGTGQSILKIVNMVGELATAMDEISLASSEQMQGISQVSVAVGQMDSVTQNNAALVEESSSASQSLSEQAHALRGMVEAFRV
ncbi:methyl-accepting chemotaxis protein, partial [Pantoea ananatis]